MAAPNSIIDIMECRLGMLTKTVLAIRRVAARQEILDARALDKTRANRCAHGLLTTTSVVYLASVDFCA